MASTTKQSIKALFFDIDGTLVSIDTHRIPSSTVESIRRARQRGVGIYISTGRPMRIINNLGDLDGLIDGYITTNGAWCTVGDETVRCAPIPKQEAEMLVRLSDEMNFATMIVGTGDLMVHNPSPESDYVFRDLLNVGYLGEGNRLEDIMAQDIIQFTPIISREQETALMPLLPHCKAARWSGLFADINSVDADKGRGLESMAGHLGLDISETMAFGDGGNDIPILRKAGVGVAMGNASDAVKAEADYVTTDILEDGVMNALEHFGVI